MSRPGVPPAVVGMEIAAFEEAETFVILERPIHGPRLGADVRVLLCSSLAPVRAAEVLQQIARSLLECGTVEAPTIADVRKLLCRIGAAT